MQHARPARWASLLLSLVLVGLAALLGAVPAGAAPPSPVLSAISFTPSSITLPGTTTTQLSITVSNLSAVSAVTLTPPAALPANATVPNGPTVGAFTAVGDVYTATVTFPTTGLGAQPGTWKISTITGSNAFGEGFTFCNATAAPCTLPGFGSTCPTFTPTIVVQSCASSVVDGNAGITVTNSAYVAPAAVSLTSVTFVPSSVVAGTSALLTITASGLVAVDLVGFSQPDTTPGIVTVGSFTPGPLGVYVGTVTFPSNSLPGTWTLTSITGHDATNDVYSFNKATINKTLTVTSGNTSPPTPVLSSVHFGFNNVQPGGAVTLTVTATGLTALDAVLIRQPDGTYGSATETPVPFTQNGNVYSATMTFPANDLTGTWQITEITGNNNVNQFYTFVAPDVLPYNYCFIIFCPAKPSTCPTFDIPSLLGVWACGSSLLSASSTSAQVLVDVDTDHDGYTDMQETAIGENPNSYCPIMRADVDGDGSVSILDLAAVASHFLQTTTPTTSRYDQDNDSQISVLDLATMASHFLANVTSCP